MSASLLCMAMTTLVIGCLYHPDQTILFYILQLRYIFAQFRNGRIWDDKWVLPTSFFVFRNNVEDFNPHGSVSDSATDKKYLLKTFAVRFSGTSAEVERCPFLNTSKAHHIYDNYSAIMLKDLLELFLFCFSHKTVNFISCIQGKNYLQFVSLCHCFLDIFVKPQW